VELRATAGSHSNPLLSVTGALEAATGLGLLVAPSVVTELLLGAAPNSPAGVSVSRVAGVALMTIGLACWLAREEANSRPAKGLVAAMLLYNVGVVAVLALARISPLPVGVAFWPVIMAHAALAAWCAAVLKTRGSLRKTTLTGICLEDGEKGNT
jgi:hypothetical protein